MAYMSKSDFEFVFGTSVDMEVARKAINNFVNAKDEANRKIILDIW